MEKEIRLTKTYADGTHGVADNLPVGENSYTFKQMLIERVGEYEDLIEDLKQVEIILTGKEK